MTALTGIQEVDLQILNKLDDVSLVNFCQINRDADYICSDQSFWLRRILKTFPSLTLEILNLYKGDRKWSEYYIQDLRKITSDEKYMVEGYEKDRLDYVLASLDKGRYDPIDLLLVNASKHGSLNVIKYFVEHGANVRAYNDRAIKLAGVYGHLDVVDYLIRHGADVHSENNLVLKSASAQGHLDVVKYLTKIYSYPEELIRDAIIWARIKRNNNDVIHHLTTLLRVE